MTFRIPHILCFVALTALSVQSASACMYVEPSRDEQNQMRQSSKPVETGADCSFVNGGVDDTYAGGPATKLGNNRFYQILEAEQGVPNSVIVADCGAREVIWLKRVHHKATLDSCSEETVDLPILKPAGPLDLTEGDTLSDLIRFAVQLGREINVDEALSWAFVDPWGRSLPQKDKVDLLCGCKLFYPDSAGANG